MKLYYELTSVDGSSINQDDFVTPIEGFTSEAGLDGSIRLNVTTNINEDTLPFEEVLVIFYSDSTKEEVVSRTVFTIVDEAANIKLLTLNLAPIMQEGDENVAIINGVNNFSPGDKVYYEIGGPFINASDFDSDFKLIGDITLGSDNQATLIIPTVINQDAIEISGNTINNDIAETFVLNIYEDEERENLLTSGACIIADRLRSCFSSTLNNVVTEGEPVSVNITVINPDDIDKVYYNIYSLDSTAEDIDIPLKGTLPITGDQTLKNGTLTFNTLINDDNHGSNVENLTIEFYLKDPLETETAGDGFVVMNSETLRRGYLYTIEELTIGSNPDRDKSQFVLSVTDTEYYQTRVINNTTTERVFKYSIGPDNKSTLEKTYTLFAGGSNLNIGSAINRFSYVINLSYDSVNNRILCGNGYSKDLFSINLDDDKVTRFNDRGIFSVYTAYKDNTTDSIYITDGGFSNANDGNITRLDNNANFIKRINGDSNRLAFSDDYIFSYSFDITTVSRFNRSEFTRNGSRNFGKRVRGIACNEKHLVIALDGDVLGLYDHDFNRIESIALPKLNPSFTPNIELKDELLYITSSGIVFLYDISLSKFSLINSYRFADDEVYSLNVSNTNIFINNSTNRTDNNFYRLGLKIPQPCSTVTVSILENRLDTIIPVKSLLFDRPFVTEGETINATLFAPNVEDGTEVYYRIFGDRVETEPFLPATQYTGNFFSIENEDSSPTGIHLNQEGSKMYIIGNRTERVYEYNLNSPFNISSAEYTGDSFFIGGQDDNPESIHLNRNGTKMYMLGSGFGSARVFEYNLNTPFEINSAEYTGNSFFVRNEDNRPQNIHLNEEGTKMYMLGRNNFMVYEYNLNTPFEISSTQYTGNSFFTGFQDFESTSIHLNKEGTKMYMVGRQIGSVHEYNLTTPFDISSTQFTGNSFNFRAQDLNPESIHLNNEGTKMHMLGANNDSVYEYDIPVITATGDITQEDIVQPLEGTMVINGGTSTLNIETLINEDDNGRLPEIANMEIYEEQTYETLCTRNIFTILEEQNSEILLARFEPIVVERGDTSVLRITGVNTNPGDRIYFTILTGDSPLVNGDDYDYTSTSNQLTKDSKTQGSVILNGDNEATINFKTLENNDGTISEVLNINFYSNASRDPETLMGSAVLSIFDTPTPYIALNNSNIVQEGGESTIFIINPLDL